MDGDRALDGEERDIYETDPFRRDTDLDGLVDGDEIYVTLSDPNDADTDDGGTQDGPEFASGTDWSVPADDASCTYPVVPRSSTVPAGLPQIQPVYVKISWKGIVDGGRVRDYTFSGGQSSRILFEFMDAGRAPLCTMDFDLSRSISAEQVWTADSGARLYAQFDLDLLDGVSNCTQVAPAIYAGYSDLRDLVEDLDLGIAYGPLVEHALELEDDLTNAGEDWQADWAPYVMGAYVTFDKVEATEIGWAMGYEATCDVVQAPGGEKIPVPRPTLAMPDEYYETTALDLLPLVELIGALP